MTSPSLTTDEEFANAVKALAKRIEKGEHKIVESIGEGEFLCAKHNTNDDPQLEEHCEIPGWTDPIRITAHGLYLEVGVKCDFDELYSEENEHPIRVTISKEKGISGMDTRHCAPVTIRLFNADGGVIGKEEGRLSSSNTSVRLVVYKKCERYEYNTAEKGDDEYLYVNNAYVHIMIGQIENKVSLKRRLSINDSAAQKAYAQKLRRHSESSGGASDSKRAARSSDSPPPSDPNSTEEMESPKKGNWILLSPSSKFKTNMRYVPTDKTIRTALIQLKKRLRRECVVGESVSNQLREGEFVWATRFTRKSRLVPRYWYKFTAFGFPMELCAHLCLSSCDNEVYVLVKRIKSMDEGTFIPITIRHLDFDGDLIHEEEGRFTRFNHEVKLNTYKGKEWEEDEESGDESEKSDPLIGETNWRKDIFVHVLVGQMELSTRFLEFIPSIENDVDNAAIPIQSPLGSVSEIEKVVDALDVTTPANKLPEWTEELARRFKAVEKKVTTIVEERKK